MVKKLTLTLTLTLAVTFLFAVLLPAAALGQANPPNQQLPNSPFSVQAGVLSVNGGGQTSSAASLVATLNLTPNLVLRADNILDPATDWQFYGGGSNYDMTHLLSSKSPINKKQFQIYVTGTVGVSRIVPAAGKTKQSIGYMAGGGLNYDPQAMGHFSVNIAEIRYGHLPGLNNSAVLFSSGIKWNF